MGKALYRKYRSRKLSEIVGQEHVTSLLENALKTDRISHAYLFTGPRGVGKTSIARILAHEINGLTYTDDSTHLDIIEIDAASNNGVDDIRDLREKVTLAPSSAAKKIYIIDEVHMLSKPAFNALLKTLEEPPEHVVFILATTDIDKLPETIISRTQRHTFRRASIEDLKRNLSRIADAEKITIDDEALTLIAEHADGGYRDSVSMFDQLISTTTHAITSDIVESSLGLAPKHAIELLLGSLQHKEFDTTIAQLKQLESNGIQPSITAHQLIAQITAQAAKLPQLLTLIDDLLKVGQSSMPSAALLAALGAYCAPKNSVSAAIVNPPHSVTLQELEDKASELNPIDDIISKQKPGILPTSKPAVVPEAELTDTKPKQIAVQRAEKLSKSPAIELDWQTIIDSAKDNSIGLATVLAKCSSQISGSTITIYARNAFYKKKLSANIYQSTLHQLLSESTGQEWEIEIIAGVAPSKNKDIASVAAIMGGGEEVSLED